MPTLHGKITACFEKGHSATVIFSPINSDILIGWKYLITRYGNYVMGKERTLLRPSPRIEYSFMNVLAAASGIAALDDDAFRSETVRTVVQGREMFTRFH